MPDSYDPNELLGLAPGSSEEEIRRAFRRKAKTVHPDVSDAPDAAEQFKRLKDAHDLLLDRLNEPEVPQRDEDLYRPTRDVSEEERESIINSFRRRREAEARRRSRRRSAVKGQARRAQRENDAFQEEMARRRAAFETRQREELQRERAAADAEARQRMEEVRRRTIEDLERAKRERAERDREDREARDRERRARRAERVRQMEDTPLECAWKGCHEADQLAVPLETALGPRRFCHQHHEEYLEFRRGKRRQTASARNQA